ncbi:glycoside hydrolase family 3 N-terminal domain-containing protein [Blastococcus sp. URHD0036]|uniref:glycoside hydrolase family 3 N-terminal domain-containing protein n=1 Tax=Blastococcus sp. URHD0036 TaxID=1380356 RepID=UPI00068F9B26|nr:glycoside hydrolase family 3 N-terminal domain-containing protein [Blastococcus sp. URHD0036]
MCAESSGPGRFPGLSPGSAADDAPSRARRSSTRRQLAVTLSILLLLLLAACGSGDDPPAADPSADDGSSAPSSAPPPPDPEAEAQAAREAQVDAALAGLDRRRQVAQLFVVGVPAADPSPTAVALVRDPGVGGVFLRGRSSLPATDYAAATAEWAALTPGLRPWVAVDQEGGQVQTLSGPSFAELPSAVVQGALPPDQLAALADGLGASLASAGITLDLAPVVDVVPAGTERRNGPIGVFGRQYGSTAAEVVPAAGAVIDGLAAHGVTATVKHFPGLGRVEGNTDDATGVTDTVTTRDDEQVAAFGTLAGSPAAPFVMTSSATYALIDPTAPAAFSSVVVTDLLRGELGFAGVVISDDLGSAEAVQDVAPGDRAVRFLAAGGTLVLTVTPDVLPAMIDAVLARAEADPAFSAQVDDAVRTALLAKAERGLLG